MSCTICLDNSGKLYKTGVCNCDTYFHKKCLSLYYAGDNKCPTCRKENDIVPIGNNFKPLYPLYHLGYNFNKNLVKLFNELFKCAIFIKAPIMSLVLLLLFVLTKLSIQTCLIVVAIELCVSLTILTVLAIIETIVSPKPNNSIFGYVIRKCFK